MATTPLRSCRMAGCNQGVPATLAQQVLCLDHFVEQTFERLRAALELCQQGQPLDPHLLDWLLADADFAVQSLAQECVGYAPGQQEKLLDLLLCLANLHEYLRHHSVQVAPDD